MQAMKKSVTATVLACALVVGGVGLTPGRSCGKQRRRMLLSFD